MLHFDRLLIFVVIAGAYSYKTPFKRTHSWVGSWPYLQTCDQAGKACIRKIQPWKVLYIGPRPCSQLM